MARDDRLIAGLDYNSFELLPGTVNPRPGMRYIEDPSNQNFIEYSEPLETTFITNNVVDSASIGVNGFVPYLLPIQQLWIVENPHDDGGKKKRKNKKKRHKNRQRQRKQHLQIMDQIPSLSPPTSPDSSDGSSTDSPTNSPLKIEIDQMGKSRRRARGSGRGRRLFPFYDVGQDQMYLPDLYAMRTAQSGPNYLPRTDLITW